MFGSILFWNIFPENVNFIEEKISQKINMIILFF
jgi:hypothetical protein